MLIGVIGGVGAGKSTVLDYLRDYYSAHIYRTDDIAKSLYDKGSETYNKIVELFGADEILCDETGEIDRRKLAKLIYDSSSSRIAVEKIVHPAVWHEVDKIIKHSDTGSLTVIETALPTIDFVSKMNEVWFVYTEHEVRIERLMKSRGYTTEKSEAIIASQLSDDEYAELATFVIDNSGTEEETHDEIYKHCERIKR